MNALSRLQQINDSLQTLLGADESAPVPSLHEGDDLLVRVLLGGKDVGKSTFLNALLGAEISPDPPGIAEGTSRFVAYVHAERMDELRARVAELPVDVRLVPHDSEPHRRLCLVDSPDFDSRYARHGAQVRRLLDAGVADGVVLLASPAKYKDRAFWDAFTALSAHLSGAHILFVLTKADELRGYLDEVRADFTETVAGALDDNGGRAAGRVFLVDSLQRGFDFKRLEADLLRPLSANDVDRAQRENLRHALSRGVAAVREHYDLDGLRRRLTASADPAHVEGVFETVFPDSYFQTVQTRLAEDEGIAALARRRLAHRSGGTLAGIGTLVSAWQRIRPSIRFGFGRSRPEGDAPATDLARLLRWGGQGLDKRLIAARRELARTAGLEEQIAPPGESAGQATFGADLELLVADLAGGMKGGGISRPLRFLLNLPIYLYLVLFVMVLLYPVFLLLNAWDVAPLPDLGRTITLDNVKVSIIGLIGYYVMAAFYVVRRTRERFREQVEELARTFVGAFREMLIDAVRRPLDGFAARLTEIEERMDRLAE